MFPATLVAPKIHDVDDFLKRYEAYLGIKPVDHIRPSRFEQTGIVVADPQRASPGVRLLVGLFGDKLGARLYAADGALLYEWPIDFFKVAPDEMNYRFHAQTHGTVLYPNGDIVLNLSGRGMMRISACGRVKWHNDHRSHHAIFQDENGDLWAPNSKGKYTDHTIAEKTFRFDTVAKFDPATGEMLESIDLVAALIRAGAQGLVVKPRLIDVMHLNDVEVLGSNMASAFPDFEAGDIMLSSRHLNQIWILDGKSHDLKWWRTGPMVGQHDPDFQPDGTITVYDNRVSEAPGQDGMGAFGGSRILKLRPAEYDYDVMFPLPGSEAFFSPFRGKHQVLDNGNVVITETDAGRAFEATPSGDIVWSYINAYDDDEVGLIWEATVYPAGYGRIKNTDCAAQ